MPDSFFLHKTRSLCQVYYKKRTNTSNGIGPDKKVILLPYSNSNSGTSGGPTVRYVIETLVGELLL
jgi:hypothetical protein